MLPKWHKRTPWDTVEVSSVTFWWVNGWFLVKIITNHHKSFKAVASNNWFQLLQAAYICIFELFVTEGRRARRSVDRVAAILPPGRALRLILSLELLHLQLCLPAGMPRRLQLGEGNCYFFLFGSGDFQHSNCTSGEERARACSALSNPSLCRMRVWATSLIFPTSGRVEEVSRGMCCWRNAHKFHMGWKFKNGQSDPWQAAVETSQWCHLPLSNIISLAGLMLRTSDAASGKHTCQLRRQNTY